jgi:RimJ/RimL family protein N-acetyltransferase
MAEVQPMIPRLETERLILRADRPQDFDAFAGFMADAEFTRFINLEGGPVSRNDAWRTLAFGIGHWVLRGYGFWAVERKSDGVYLGRVGMYCPEGWPGLEVGWIVGRPYWGNGYATEAGRAAMDYAFLTQPVDRIISTINPANAASQRVAKKLGETQGERRELPIRGKILVVDIWSIGRDEWRRRRDA